MQYENSSLYASMQYNDNTERDTYRRSQSPNQLVEKETQIINAITNYDMFILTYLAFDSLFKLINTPLKDFLLS